MKSILALQSYLQASGMSINVIIALFFGFISLTATGYLIEQHISKDEKHIKNRFDLEN